MLGGKCRHACLTSCLSGSDTSHSLDKVGEVLKAKLVESKASEWMEAPQKAMASLPNIENLPLACHGQTSIGGDKVDIADEEKDSSMNLATVLAHRICGLSAIRDGGVGGKYVDTVRGSGAVPTTNGHASDGRGLRDASNHGRFGPCGGIDAADRLNIPLGSGSDTTIRGSERMDFDPNEPPFTAVATSDLNLVDPEILSHLDLWEGL